MKKETDEPRFMASYTQWDLKMVPYGTMIALHEIVTVQRVFPDGPGKVPADTGAPFGGAPFLRPQLSGLADGY